MAKDAYYFSHDANARHDPRLTQLKICHGMAAIGVWWNMVEMLREADGYCLPMDEATIGTIAYEGMTTPEDITGIIGYCVELGLFERDDDCFWSPSLCKRMEIWEASKQEKSQRAADAAKKRWDAERENADAMRTHSDGMQSDATKRKETKGKKEEYKTADAALDYLNEKSGRSYKHTDTNRRHVLARLHDGFTLEDCKRVVDIKVDEWKGGEMDKYLRPETLFGTKFDGYLNQKDDESENELNPVREYA